MAAGASPKVLPMKKMMTLAVSPMICLTALALAGCSSSSDLGDAPIASAESEIDKDHRYKPASLGLGLTGRFFYAHVRNGLGGQNELWRRPRGSEQWQTVAGSLGSFAAAGNVVAFWKYSLLFQRRCVARPLEILSDTASSPIAVDVGGCIQEAAIDPQGRRIFVRVITEDQSERVNQVGSIRIVSFDGAILEDIPNVRPEGNVEKIHVVDGVVYGYVHTAPIRGGLGRLDPATKTFLPFRVRCQTGDGFAHMCRPDDQGVMTRDAGYPVLATDGPDAVYVAGPTRLVRAAGSPYYDAIQMYPKLSATRANRSVDTRWSFAAAGKGYLATSSNNFNQALNTGSYDIARVDFARFDAADTQTAVPFVDDVPWVSRMTTGSTGLGAVAHIVLQDGNFYVLRYADARDGYPVIEVVAADAPSLPRENPGPQGLQPPPACCGG